ncbi:DUF4433 domain-containing protein [bacterium]|nr:DUF4433 domain-containing protein [bacterium]
MVDIPFPTPIFRLIHIENLEILLRRGGLHAPKRTPNDGLVYKTIHNTEIQVKRNSKAIPCEPYGVIHDYVSFYFGYLSPMMLQLHTGQVANYSEGQTPLIYLVSNVQSVIKAGCEYVFSDGHGIAAISSWYNSTNDLDKIDWNVVCLRYWIDTVDDPDRQRRKQAEFLIYHFCEWSIIEKIVVLNEIMKTRVEAILKRFDSPLQTPVEIKREWYY